MGVAPAEKLVGWRVRSEGELMGYLRQHPADIRIRIREVTTLRDLDDEEFGEQIAKGIIYLDEDDCQWLVDTFDEMVEEVETLRLDVASARARADQAERSRSSYSDEASRLASDPHWQRAGSVHPWGPPR